jgi:hypothetical protein
LDEERQKYNKHRRGKEKQRREEEGNEISFSSHWFAARSMGSPGTRRNYHECHLLPPQSAVTARELADRPGGPGHWEQASCRRRKEPWKRQQRHDEDEDGQDDRRAEHHPLERYR